MIGWACTFVQLFFAFRSRVVISSRIAVKIQEFVRLTILIRTIRPYRYVIMMSPSRAEGFSAWLGSARDLFHFSLELKIDWKTSWNFNSHSKTYFLLFSIIKLTKSCIWMKLFVFKNTKDQINDQTIDWNHDTGLLLIKTWGKNELKNFGSARFQLGS